MSSELKLHIRKLQSRAIISLIIILITLFSIVLGISFLFIRYYIAIIFFTIAALCIFFLICNKHIVKKDSEKTIYNPIIFISDKYFSFEKIIDIFANLTSNENQLSTSKDVWFFRFKKILNLRIVLYRTEKFNKKEYDNKKDCINKKANKELNISQWCDSSVARKMMRFNIIYADTLNDELYQFISQNANRNLTRIEGIINIAIVENRIIIPPLYGECYLMEISRYKNTVKFINRVLINQR